MKWLWKYANDKQTLWGKVIETKYEEEDGWMTKEVTTPYGVNLWRSIRILWNELKSFSRIKVNNGRKTCSWNDDWHEVGNMETRFPEIHSLVNHRHSTIDELWTQEGWNFSF